MSYCDNNHNNKYKVNKMRPSDNQTEKNPLIKEWLEGIAQHPTAIDTADIDLNLQDDPATSQAVPPNNPPPSKMVVRFYQFVGRPIPGQQQSVSNQQQSANNNQTSQPATTDETQGVSRRQP